MYPFDHVRQLIERGGAEQPALGAPGRRSLTHGGLRDLVARTVADPKFLADMTAAQIDTLSAAEQLGDLGTLCDPALQKFCSISRNFCGARYRYDDSDIRQSIPYVCEAEPGIKTYLDLPLIAGRAKP